MNWGKNLTMIGAIRSSGWVALTTRYKTVTRVRFLSWFDGTLLPKLTAGDVVVMDNLAAHKDPGIQTMARLRGVEVRYLPPHSPDFNAIESAWALQKQYVRRCAPRDPQALRRVARRARHRVKPHHIHGWFAHCGYDRKRFN